MRIAMLCPRASPPMVGGAERLWEGIVAHLNADTDHDAELVAVDTPEHSFAEVVTSYCRFDELELADYDLVITGKYPAWMVRHPRHVVYMCHPLRGLYDQFGGALHVDRSVLSRPGRRLAELLQSLAPRRPGARDRILEAAMSVVQQVSPAAPDHLFPGPLARALVHWLDADALSPERVSKWLAISATVAGRPGYFPPDARVEVVVPPSGLEGLAPCAPGAGFFTVSRLDVPKRLHLLVEAMGHVEALDASLRIAGVGPEHDRLVELSRHDPRVTLLGRISDQQLATEYRSCRAVPFVPFDEDLGLVTLEAHAAAKPVVTCLDSGGVAELVDDGVTGLVVRPDPAEIAEALTRLHADAALAAELGRRGHDAAAQVTWANVITALLAPGPASSPPAPVSRSGRPHVVVLSTYPAEPDRHGGQVRLRRLLGALAEHADVELLCIGDQTTLTEVAPGFVQRSFVPHSEFYRADHALGQLAGAPTGDVAATLYWHWLGELPEEARRVAPHADATIVCQPYLLPLVPPRAPLIYDSQNDEGALKAAMYRDTAAGRALAASVRRIETEATRRAVLATAVSAEDRDHLASLATMARIEIVPNGCNAGVVEYVEGRDRAARRDAYLRVLHRHGVAPSTKHVAVFIGSGHPPNIEAGEGLVEMAAEVPDVAVVLVGSHVAALRLRTLPDNVVPVGVASEQQLHRLLTSCDVALNPMRSGSGTNIKMLDYFAAGAPVVASAIGARGLGVSGGVEYAEADPADLAESLRRVIDEPAEATRRARQARLAAELHDWRLIGAHYVHVVLAAIRP